MPSKQATRPEAPRKTFGWCDRCGAAAVMVTEIISGGAVLCDMCLNHLLCDDCLEQVRSLGSENK